jgi:plasmid replication initiation protein
MEVLKVLQHSKYFRKTNYLIEAKYKLSVLQTFIFTQAYMSLADENIAEPSHKIYFKDIIENFGLSPKGDTYDKIVEAARKLREKELIFQMVDEEGKEATVFTGFFTKVKVNKRRDGELSNMEVFIDEELKPHLIQLKRFTLLNKTRYAYICGQLHHPMVIRIYDLLKQYETIGKRKMEVQKLKELLDVSDKYALYGSFKQKIILEAQKRLSESADIKFDFEEIKQGKAVTELVFYIRPNIPEDLPDRFKDEIRTEQAKQGRAEEVAFEVIEQKPENPYFVELNPMAKVIGVTPSVLRQMIEQQPIESVRNGLIYTKQAVDKNMVKTTVDGYFVTAVKKKFTNDSIENDKKRLKKQTEQVEKDKEIRKLQNDLDILNDDYNARVNAVIREITATNNDITVQAVESVKLENQTYFQLKEIDPSVLTLEDYRRDPILRMLVIGQIQKQNFTYFEDIENDFRPKIKALEKKISQLKR